MLRNSKNGRMRRGALLIIDMQPSHESFVIHFAQESEQSVGLSSIAGGKEKKAVHGASQALPAACGIGPVVALDKMRAVRMLKLWQ